MKTAGLIIAILAALALPGGALADETGNHDEHECVLLTGVPHHNWETIVCDEQVVFVENPSGQIIFRAPFVDFD